ncbi:hypothetical protein ACM66B_002099 [Microbotryomycetes sp. NB124-2]
MSTLFHTKSSSGLERQRTPSHLATFFPFTTEHTVPHLMPRLDVIEKGEQILVDCEVPGLKPDQISLELHEDQLVLSGKEHSEQEYKEEDYRVHERMSSAWSRSLPVPNGTKAEDVQATLKDGVLHMTMPKRSKHSERHQIQVKLAGEQ